MSTVRGSVIRGESGHYQANGHHGRFAPCVRCGRVRAVKANTGEMCSDCKSVDPHFGEQSYR